MGKCARMALAILALAGWAAADVQDVETGGKIEIYGAYYSNFFDNAAGNRIPPAFLRGRPIGINGTTSPILTNGKGSSLGFWEQRSRIHTSATFSENIGAFIEVDAINTWGEDFRSANYVTGADVRADSRDDVEIYQAYIDIATIFGWPLNLRVGRQELEFGSGWLVGADPGPDPFVGLSFDALRVTYGIEDLSIDAWAAKLAESFFNFADNDIDFYGIYASYALNSQGESSNLARRPWPGMLFLPTYLLSQGIGRVGPFRGRHGPSETPLQVDLYWMLVRDDQKPINTALSPLAEQWESILGRDQYGTTSLHTIGTRGSGSWPSFDYEFEIAYQWGGADAVGVGFVPVGRQYGADRASWSNWAGNMEFGYKFDVALTPRIYIGGAYYGGQDNRDISFWDYLNPFHKPQASISFNRLFSSWREDAFLDASGLSNFWKAYAGMTAQFPSKAVEVGFNLAYLEAIEPFDRPVDRIINGHRVPFFSPLPFWTVTGATDLGWQTSVYAAYQYTQALSFEAGWSHFFVGDALADGAFTDMNGSGLFDGMGTHDVDYIYFLTTLEF